MARHDHSTLISGTTGMGGPPRGCQWVRISDGSAGPQLQSVSARSWRAFGASSTRVGEGFAFGFGAFIAFFGLLAVLARNRTPDHWGLVVVGLAMFMVPFLGNGYNADLGPSWTCWVAGGLAMILGGIGWVGDKTPTDHGVNEIGGGQAKRSGASGSAGRRSSSVSPPFSSASPRTRQQPGPQSRSGWEG